MLGSQRPELLCESTLQVVKQPTKQTDHTLTPEDVVGCLQAVVLSHLAEQPVTDAGGLLGALPQDVLQQEAVIQGDCVPPAGVRRHLQHASTVRQGWADLDQAGFWSLQAWCPWHTANTVQIQKQVVSPSLCPPAGAGSQWQQGTGLSGRMMTSGQTVTNVAMVPEANNSMALDISKIQLGS